MKSRKRSHLLTYMIGLLFMVGVIVFLSGCTLPFIGGASNGGNQPPAQTAAPQNNLQATVDAQNLQLTAQALQITAQAMQSNVQTQEPPSAQTEAPPAAETEQPPAAQTEPPSTTIPQISEDELLPKIKGAKILLFEDMSGNRFSAPRYVKETLDNAGYTYTDVGSAEGWLKDQLISGEKWDLIIASSEYTGKISGEFFDYFNDYLGQGTGLIMEAWDADSMFQGKIRKITDKCGIDYQMDWYNPPSRSVWFLQRDNPIFNTPNTLEPSLRTYMNFWRGDIGDLWKVKVYAGQVVGDAILLAGTKVEDKKDHANLVTCIGGRMVLQSFPTHEYDRETIEKLWENYVYNVLRNHFIYKPQ